MLKKRSDKLAPLGQKRLPMVYTMGREAQSASRQWFTLRVSAAKTALRRTVAAGMAVVLCFGMLPVSAFAAETGCQHVCDAACSRQELICGQEESQGHAHGADCFAETRTCTLTEHTHSDACMTEGVLTCTQTEHTHDPACFESTLTCDKAQTEGHAHVDACYNQVLDCRHVCDETCGGLEPTKPVCGTCGEAHDVADCPVKAVGDLIAALPTPEEIAAMTEEERQESGAYEKMGAAYDAYDALSNAQMALLPDAMSTFTALQAALGAPVTLAAVEKPLDKSITYFTSGWTYTIADAAQLTNLATLVNDGKDGAGSFFKLTGPIDLSSHAPWTPIGTEGKMFQGTFDGGGFTVSNMTAGSSEATYQGLFGCVNKSGAVKNVTVSGTVTGTNRLGGIVGQNAGTIENCVNNSTISTPGTSVGGIAGWNTGTITGCVNNSAISTVGGLVGGIVGRNNEGTINRCVNYGVISTAGTAIGGIVGSGIGGTIQQCHNAGDIFSSPSQPGGGVGGIVGNASGVVTHCYNTANVCGIRGADENVSVTTIGPRNVGGIVGSAQNGAAITYCYNTGTVFSDHYSGGITGDIDAAKTGTVTVENCVMLGAGVIGRAQTWRVLGGQNYYDTPVTQSALSARSDMLVTMNGMTTTGENGESKNGTDIALETALGAVFSGWDGAIWDIPSANLTIHGALPTLKGLPAGTLQNPTLPPVTGAVSLPSTLSVPASMSKKLTATVTGGGDFRVLWNSRNPAVATVDESGNVTGVSMGTAVITATAGGRTGTCTVTVTAPPVELTDAVNTLEAGTIYTIENQEQLQRLQTLVNGGQTGKNCSFLLTQDIALTGPWTPIGTEDNLFSGAFNGQGHTISGLSVDAPSSNYQGLFGVVGLRGYFTAADADCVIADLTVDGSVKGNNYVGGIVGQVYQRTTIERCISRVAVTSEGSAGGVVGELEKSGANVIRNCYATGAVTGSGSVGGIVGMMYGSGSTKGNFVSRCYATGAVQGRDNVGGIAGIVGAGGTSAGPNAGLNNCVALNSIIRSNSGSNAGRVAGAIYTANNSTDNYARADMLVIGEVVNGTTTDKNGADIARGAQQEWNNWFSDLTGWTPPASGATLVMGQPLPTLRGETAPILSALTYTVTFYDGTTAYGSDTPQAPKTVEQLQPTTQPTSPTKVGTTFTDWYTQATGGEKFDFATLITQNTNLYARWSVNAYPITFDMNSAAGTAPDSQNVMYGSTYGVLPTATCTGWDFKGWFTQTTGGQQVTAETLYQPSTPGGHTLYAHWELATPTVTATGYSGIYDGQEHSITATVTNTGAGITYYYQWNRGDYEAASGPNKTTYAAQHAASSGNYTCTVTATSGSVSKSATAECTMEIKPKTLTIRIADGLTISKIYDDTKTVEPDDCKDGLVLEGGIDGEKITPSGTWEYEDWRAGTGKKVTVSEIKPEYATGLGVDPRDYSYTPTVLTTTGDIEKRQLTHNVVLAEAGKTKTYDGTTTIDPSFVSGGLTNVVGEDDVKFASKFAFQSADVPAEGENVGITCTEWSMAGNDVDNYVLPEKPADIQGTITPKPVTVVWTAADSYTYTGADQSGTVKANYVDLDSGTVALDVTFNEAFKDAGDYVATAGASNRNYALTNGTLNLTIAKAESSIEAPAMSSATSKSVTLTAVTASVGDGTVEYAVSETATAPTQDDQWQTELTFLSLKENTAYHFFARVKEGQNYKLAVSDGTQISTLAKKLTGIAVTTQPDVMRYVAFEKLKPAGMVVTATYDDDSTQAISDYTIAYVNGGDSFHAGETSVELAYDGQTVTLTGLHVAKTAVLAPTIASKPYTGAHQIAEVTTANPRFTVTKNLGGTDVGSYDVILTLNDTVNYEWTDSKDAVKTLTFTITKATNVWNTQPSCANITFGDTLTPAATAQFGATVYTYAKTENGAYTDTKPSDARDWWVKAAVADTNNYTGLESKVAFKISPKAYDAATFFIAPIPPQSFISGEIKPTPEIKWGETLLVKDTDYTLDYENNTAVGNNTAKVKITFQNNYSGNPELTFSIVENPLAESDFETVFGVTAEALKGWHNKEIRLTAKSGWAIGDSADSLSSGGSVTLKTQGKASTQSVYVRKDGEAKVSLATVTYALDTSKPEVGAVTGNAADWTNQDVILQFTPSDNLSEVAYVFVELGSSSISATNNGGTYSATIDKNCVVNITVMDTAENISDPVTVTVDKIDQAAPVISAVDCSGTAGLDNWYTTDVTVTVTANDEQGGSAIKGYSFDGGTTWQSEAAKIYDTSGSHTVTVWVKDGAGNIAMREPALIKLDKETPAAPAVVVTAGDEPYIDGWTAKNVVFALSGDATTSGHANYQVKVGSADWTDVTEIPYTIKTNTPGDEGVKYSFRAVNNAGTAGTASSETNVKRRSLDESVKNDPANKYVADNLTPSGTQGENDWYTGDMTITVAKKETLDGNPAKTYYTIDGGVKTELTGTEIKITTDGDHTIVIWTEDAAGNETTRLSYESKVDKTVPDAPTVTIPAAVGTDSWHTTAPLEITVAATDAASGVAKWEYSTDGGTTWVTGENGKFTIATDGTYNVQIKVTDNAGNVTTTQAVEVKLDTTAPDASVGGVPGISAWTKNDVTLTVAASDATAGLADEPYSFDGGVTWQTGATKRYTQNTGDIVICVKDAAGNIETLDTVAITVIDKIDPAAPVVKIGSDEITEATTAGFGKTIGITLTPTGGSPEHYSYVFNGGEAVESDFTEKTELSLTALPGSNTLAITLTDAAGNKTEKRYNVSITTETPDPPAIDTGSIPGVDGAWSKGDVTVTLPGDGKDYVYRELPDGDWKPVENGKIVFDKDSDSGNYELAQKVEVDGKDYYGEVTKITVMVDKTAPVIDAGNIVATPALDAPTNGSVVITIPAADGNIGSGVKQVTVIPSANATVTGPVDGKCTVTVTENGAYTVTVTDNAGNSSTTTQVVTGIDKTKPGVTITPEIDGGKWYGKTEIIVTGTDTGGSGVASTVITVDGVEKSNPVSITENGSHTVVVTVTDKAGNETKVTNTVNVDPAIDDFQAAVDGLGSNPTTEAVLGVLDDYLNRPADQKEHIQNSGTGAEAWEKLQDALEEEYETVKDTIVEVVNKDNPTIADINDAESLFNILDEKTQDKIDKGKLDQLIKDRDAAQPVVDQVNGADSYEEQKAAVSAYDRLTQEQKKLADGALPPGTLTDMKDDVADVGNVIGKIDGVKKPYTPATKDAITAAKDAYNSLDGDQKQLLPDYAKKKLDALEKLLDNVKALKDKISVLTVPYTHSEDAAIKDAQAAYNKLSADEKAMVDNELKAKLDTLYQAMLDAIATGNAAANKVIQDIIKVKDDPKHTVEDIQKVKDAYDKLPDEAKQKVDETVLSAPTTVKDILDQLVQDKNAVEELVNDINKLDPDKLAPSDVGGITAADEKYVDLTDDQKALVDNSTAGKLEELTDAVEDAQKTEDAIGKIPGHGGGSTNPDGTPNMGECGNGDNGNSDNTTTGGHTPDEHKKAIEEAKYAYEMLSDAGRKLIDSAVVTKLNNEYRALMTYLAYVNHKEIPGAAVEVVGLAEKVTAPNPPLGGKTVVAVEIKVEDPPAIHKPTAPEGKTQALSVDVKLTATKQDSSGQQEGQTEFIQPDSDILVKLLLPAGYKLDTLEIVHVKDSGAQRPILDFHIVTESDNSYAIFLASSFSHFVFFAEKTPTGGGGAGGGTVTPMPKPDIPGTDHGSTTINPQQPKPGTGVVVTPKPDEGYVVDKIIITDQNGKEISVKDNGNGTFSYTQPNGKVTVTVTFKPANKGEVPFIDVMEDDWFWESVRRVYEKGLMAGTSDTTFSPNLSTSRGMIVTILWQMESKPAAKSTSPFADVAGDKYYASAVAWAAENGIVQGYSNSSFGPGDLVTREQLAAVLYRYAQFKGQDTSATNDLTQFSDQPSAWAKEAMSWAVGAGMISGKGKDILDPKGDATRAQVAVMLMRFLER